MATFATCMDLIHDAIHIMPGDSAGGALKPTRMRVRVDHDMLACGPCDPDPRRHANLRSAFWKSEYELGGWRWTPHHDLKWPRTGRVALWTSSRLADRLFFWRAVDRLADREIELWRVEARSAGSVVRGVGAMPPGGIRHSVARARSMNTQDLAAARRAWRAFTSGDLEVVARLVDRELRSAILDSLPRRSDGHLRVSKRDEMLLRGFNSWRTPLDALKPHLSKLLVFGDLVILTRLLRWTRMPNPTLTARNFAATISWKGPELMLTPFGRRVLEELPSPADAPPLFMGGQEIYGPNTYAITGSGRIVRL